MHILHLIKTSEGATWALNLLQEIKERHPEITYSVAIPFGGKHLTAYLKLCRDVYEFDYQVDLSIFQRGKKLRSIVKKDNPDIIHGWFVQTTLYSRLFLRKFNIPKIFQVVGPFHLEHFTLRWADILSADKNDYWIASSKCVYNKYKEYRINDNRLFLNYPYTDVYKLLDDTKNIKKRDFRLEYNIPREYKIIGTASYFYPPKFYEKFGIKGHEYLLKTFAKILRKRQDIVLIIAGSSFGKSSGYENKIKQLAYSLDPKRIIFSGKYSHVYEVIDNFDAFLYLSKSENLGGVFESLLYKIPTIASNRGALPELVIDQVTGYLVDLNNIEEIAVKTLKVLEQNNEDMTHEGRKKVIATFDKEAIINKGYSIYYKISNMRN